MIKQNLNNNGNLKYKFDIDGGVFVGEQEFDLVPVTDEQMAEYQALDNAMATADHHEQYTNATQNLSDWLTTTFEANIKTFLNADSMDDVFYDSGIYGVEAI